MSTLDGFDPAAVALAAERLAAGGLVAFATETVYGLGARADDDAATAAIFTTKGRPAGHPLIVHVASLEDARFFGDLSAPAAERLAARFWPGPLTLIVPRRPGVAEAASGGQPSIGLRWPSHPVALALLQAAAARGVRGVAAPSANRFGRISPTRAAHVAVEFGPELMVLDGGDCPMGIESAIVDCTRQAPALLRPGVLDRPTLEAVLGDALRDGGAGAPRAPGTLAAHYAPNAPLRLMDGAQLKAAFEVLAGGAAPQGLAVYSRSVRQAPAGIHLKVMPDQANEVAHELFSVLRDFDARGVRLIWVETPPPSPAWEGVRDRLARAAAA
ncbi:L-threonylcarbamoyladenylate synthase [Pseudorhodoferax sp.]|uniref:L-threonylcarbamoyladenylate synthase n=1 Tax=Pseudorhodoferax sp. TaxID=1993553 RepID=UPI002DD68D56|nr:L-threonylcarbamoyladenylate synthase [Pseudorhodoferax sp.]